MTAPVAAVVPLITVVRNEVMSLKNSYNWKNGMENKNLRGPRGVEYSLKPVLEGRDGNWVSASGFSRGYFHCDQCGDAPGGDCWEFKRGDVSLVLNDADLHQIDQHPESVSQVKTARLYQFFIGQNSK